MRTLTDDVDVVRPPWTVLETRGNVREANCSLVCSNSFRTDLNVGPEGKNGDRRNAFSLERPRDTE